MQEVSKLENAEEILNIPISYEERGKKIGRAEGRKEGLQTGKKEVALEMIKQNFTVDEIKKLTKLTKGQIEQLRKQI